MGTLDEAIKEHLELRRQQGVGEDEIQQAEAEAFGPAGDDAPGASLTAPAGEGDQLDKVFSGEGEADDAPPTTVLESGSSAAEAPKAEAAVEEAEVEVSETVQAQPTEVEAPAESEAPSQPVEPAPEPPPEPRSEAPAEPEAPAAPEPVDLGDDADASDLLEAERASLSGHPTENYDVDAAIAEEEELDLLSGSRLSEELDRALEDPGPSEAAGPEGGSIPESEAEVFEEAEVEEDVEVEEPLDSGLAEDLEPDQPGEPPVEESGSASPLEETPDFLDDPDASDELWFEQGEPKDFDFGD